MKIGIDTFGCDHGRSGIGSYFSSLVQNFNNNDEVEFELFGAEIDRYTYARDNNLSFESILLPDSPKAEKFWHHFLCNRFARKRKYDVMLFPASSTALPSHFGVPSVAVVNDIVSNLFASKTFSERLRLKRSLKKVNKIIAASQYIKKDLKRIGIKPEKIVVIHNGINHSMFYQVDLLNNDYIEINPFSIRRPYFIYSSTMSSSLKHHCDLIKAFELFKDKTGLPHRLVLAGGAGAATEDVKRTALESKYASDIFLTGYFPHETFPALYSGSEACVFPSEIEGVGLPVLEAMASGIPVACSNGGALTEVAGDKAILFNSENLNEIADAMEKICTDKKFRKSMIEQGVDWAKRFSWEKTAQETLEVLKSVVKK
ncbi:MAG: glycosyltransferase family 4 protein [Treponema sp.]|nr:glycosyltransferase family 4 protein [Candidatus Treponema equifaecale]